MQPLCVHRQACMYVIPEYAFCVCVCMRAFAHTLAMYVSDSYATVFVCVRLPHSVGCTHIHNACSLSLMLINCKNQHSTVNNRGLAAATTTDLYSSP